MEKWILIYDGDCGFCKRWIARWQRAASETVRFEPYQSPGLLDQFPETSRQECERSVVLIHLETREKWTAAKAVFQALATNPQCSVWLWFYLHVPLVRPVSEWCYRLVARNRQFFSKSA